MEFRDNSGVRSAPSMGKKVISASLLAALLLSTNSISLASSEENHAKFALDIAASTPLTAKAEERQSDIEDAAEAAISSVKGIVSLMKQAQEVSAMLPSRRAKPQTAPKTGFDTAMNVASRLPSSMRPSAAAAAEKPAAQAKTAIMGAQNLIWPVNGMIYSAFHATRGRRAHGAIDIVAQKGAPIAAAADGIVSVAANGGKNFKGYGKIIILDHGKGLYTVYAHCNALLVKLGQKVRQGEYIATVGRTGRATTDHCHFEVRVAGKKHDPLAYLPSRPDVVKATNYKAQGAKKK